MLPLLIPVDDGTRVAEARRLAVSSGRFEGLGDQASDEVAIIATELASNLLKHASSGHLYVNGLSATGEPGVELISIDRGPGMALKACTVDGYSTAGTAGNGLGAVSRLADVFDGYSQPDRGTVLLARKYASRSRNGPSARWTLGAVRVPYPGESACGDNYSVKRNGALTCLMMADGLGHGVLAADASNAAVEAFRKTAAPSAASTLEDLHLALRPTRGAAVAVIFIEHQSGAVHYAGLGNITGVLLGGERPQMMISHNGTAGLEARRFQQFDYRLPPEGTLVMHSDGLATSWSMDRYPGLLRRHPSVIAAMLYRDARRGRDDSCVLVGRYMHE